MDLIVETIKNGLIYFLLAIALIIVIKAYLVSSMKRFDIAEIFFSFFRHYSNDEIRMSSNKKRVAYMKQNNFLNYILYFLVGIVLFVYIVTRGS